MIDIGVASYIHDWAMTDRKLIILLQPWIQTRTRPPFIDGFVWKPEQGMKYLIVDKDDLTKTRWAQGPARAFYHTGAAWEESDGTIRLDSPVASVAAGSVTTTDGRTVRAAQVVVATEGPAAAASLRAQLNIVLPGGTTPSLEFSTAMPWRPTPSRRGRVVSNHSPADFSR
jgi:carotenoid cleavage dioxygenase-like enzyme